MALIPLAPAFICRRCIHDLSRTSTAFRPKAPRLSSPNTSRLLHSTRTLNDRRRPPIRKLIKQAPEPVNNRPRPSTHSTPLIRRFLSAPDSLTPSAPSAPLAARATIPPTPERPTKHTTLQSSALESYNWYWETIPPTISQKSQSNHFFTKAINPRFLRSVAYFRHFPASDVPEIAFVGRSNVGKSSLLNAIVNADTKALLARTSRTPGFTKTMNLYGIAPGNGVSIKSGNDKAGTHDNIVGVGGLTLVDMPGYGEGSLSAWGVEIMKYLQGRKQLRRVFVLIDAEHGIKDKDRSLLASLRLGGVPHQVVLSKLDKLYIPQGKEIRGVEKTGKARLTPRGTLEELRKRMERIKSEIKPPVGGGAIGELLGCSSEVLVDGRRLGIDPVRFAMLQAIGYNFSGKKVKSGDRGVVRKINAAKLQDTAWRYLS